MTPRSGPGAGDFPLPGGQGSISAAGEPGQTRSGHITTKSVAYEKLVAAIPEPSFPSDGSPTGRGRIVRLSGAVEIRSKPAEMGVKVN